MSHIRAINQLPKILGETQKRLYPPNPLHQGSTRIMVIDKLSYMYKPANATSNPPLCKDPNTCANRNGRYFCDVCYRLF